MLAVVFATEAESRPFLKLYQRGRFEGLTENEVASDDQITIIIVGSGKIKATLRTERLLVGNEVSHLLHVGSCQSLVPEIPIGSVCRAVHVLEGDRVELAAPTYPRMPLAKSFKKLKDARLITQDHSIHGQTELTYWQRIADITDMTGYGVAYVSATHGIPCSIVKVVAGVIDSEDINLLLNIDESLETLGQYLVKNLDKLLELK
ncbi:MAG: 5'-methylthioadenosine nucleosidase [Rhodothermales bacterium]|nr:5'-methylthioadenosine nucleosidase [Rhodothermales bacterium]